jgi:hypothetical protein
MSEIKGRLADVRGRIEEAALRAGRPVADVEIVAVTKGHPASVLRDVAASGLPIIGENRVDEAELKYHELGSAISSGTRPGGRSSCSTSSNPSTRCDLPGSWRASQSVRAARSWRSCWR